MKPGHPAGDKLGELAAALESLPAGGELPPETVERAFQWAEALREAHPEAGERAAALTFAVAILRGLPPTGTTSPQHLRESIDRLATLVPVSRNTFGRLVVAAPRPDSTLEHELALLLAFAQADGVALWRLGGVAPTLIAGVGSVDAQPPVLDEIDRQGVAIEVPTGVSALVCTRSGLPEQEWRALLDAAAPAIAAILRGGADDSASVDESDPAEATRRQLSRLRFDLHDGPQQDVILLADDLRMFQSQLETVVAGHPNAARLVGRIEDLKARLVALDGDLRRISSLLASPLLQAESFAAALSQLTEAFTARSGIVPTIELQGHLNEMTDGQQVTLLGLVREALNNIREHSDAENVSISVRADEATVRATVTDDGSGFEPESALIRAAREGHLGLVGMHERVRMLGGNTQIDSRLGGPTVISVVIPTATAQH